MKILNREPALVLAFVAAVVNLAIGFGLDWTAEQVTLVNVAVAALVGLLVRQQVTPVD